MNQTKDKKQDNPSTLSAKELADKIQVGRKELAKLRQGVVLGELKNYRKIRAQKKEIARALTQLSAKLGVE